MPLFEFKCEKCGNEFETLVFGKEEVVCEKCGSKNIKKKFSAFSVGNSSSASSSACRSCETGSCSAPYQCPSGTCGL